MVEQNKSGAYTEILYSPIGKLALMTRQIAQNIFLPLPGGEQATYTSQTIRFRHSDWLGSSRFESNINEQEYGDVAYAAFGENYAVYNTPYFGFTGQNQDTVAGTYDFLYREYNPTQGRWISPDPAGLSAANFGDPQSFNRYAYVANNPLSFTDPQGLQVCAGCHFFGGGGDNLGCSADDVATSCDLVQAMLGSSFPGDGSNGAADQCPNNDFYKNQRGRLFTKSLMCEITSCSRDRNMKWVALGITTTLAWGCCRKIAICASSRRLSAAREAASLAGSLV
jgi:RHS repeat-associated protein